MGEKKHEQSSSAESTLCEQNRLICKASNLLVKPLSKRKIFACSCDGFGWHGRKGARLVFCNANLFKALFFLDTCFGSCQRVAHTIVCLAPSTHLCRCSGSARQHAASLASTWPAGNGDVRGLPRYTAHCAASHQDFYGPLRPLLRHSEPKYSSNIKEPYRVTLECSIQSSNTLGLLGVNRELERSCSHKKLLLLT
jgi:hypothetical protein